MSETLRRPSDAEEASGLLDVRFDPLETRTIQASIVTLAGLVLSTGGLAWHVSNQNATPAPQSPYLQPEDHGLGDRQEGGHSMTSNDGQFE